MSRCNAESSHEEATVRRKEKYIRTIQELIRGHDSSHESMSSSSCGWNLNVTAASPQIVVLSLEKDDGRRGPIITNTNGSSNNKSKNHDSAVVVAVDTMDRPGVLLDISKIMVRFGFNCHKTEAAVVGKRSLSVWHCEVVRDGVAADVQEIYNVLYETLKTCECDSVPIGDTRTDNDLDKRNNSNTTTDDGVFNSDLETVPPLVRYSRYRSEFREIATLGRGGFGAVFQCKNILDGRQYAVKKVLIRSRLDSNGKLPMEYNRTLDRVLREVKILALLDHKNIVRYYTAWLELEAEERHVVAFSPEMFEKHDDIIGCSHVKDSEENDLGFTFDRGCSINSSQESSFNEFSHSHIMDSPWARYSYSDRCEHSNHPNEKSTMQSLVENDTAHSSQKHGLPNASDTVIYYQSHILYIQMQLCQRTLLDYFHSRQENVIDIPLWLRMFCHIAQGVQNVHAKGLIHRDLKPSNCFVDDANIVKIGDFGLSRESRDHQSDVVEVEITTNTEGGEIGQDEEKTAGVGTSSYASPEQISGTDYNSSSDIYSLGIILFELCYPMNTGMERCKVFDGIRQKIPVFPDKWYSTVASKFPDLQSLLQRMLSHDPKQRPTASEIVSCVQSILSEYTVQSLGKTSESEDIRILRVEAQNYEMTLEQVMRMIQDASPNIQIHEYGLRSKGPKKIMEFALTMSKNGNVDEVMELNNQMKIILQKLESKDEIKVVRILHG